MAGYRKKTNWTPQAEREFTVTDERPDRFDPLRLKDLFLVAALSDGDNPPEGWAARRLSPGTNPKGPRPALRTV
jgi:hypothetical protein